ncbi:MAG: hypothetical protein KatS3mg113_0204 [Planctomycetaceae bacterium]|nr:MAG: hypothetical protein KatS3mg113_0204 [Planctomycetaceae bacterium]
MKRIAVMSFIALYLVALSWGIVAHALRFGNFSHPLMYFVVWDMFCGWQSYESRYHLVGEGESGTLYELSPGPWPAFCPFGDIPRHHYDALGHTFYKMARFTLDHTEHEPMRRIMVIEECWPKKYNLPPHLWALRIEEPREPYSYFWLKAAYSTHGEILQAMPDFAVWQTQQLALNNPRLQQEAMRHRPVFAIQREQRTDSLVTPAAWFSPPEP